MRDLRFDADILRIPVIIYSAKFGPILVFGTL